jgi:hypothetical protein
MPRSIPTAPTRRTLLVLSLGTGLTLGGATAVLAKTPKSAVGYQTHPNGANACASCASFLPAADPARPGACKIVDGEIPPTGWCALYARKA